MKTKRKILEILNSDEVLKNWLEVPRKSRFRIWVFGVSAFLFALSALSPIVAHSVMNKTSLILIVFAFISAWYFDIKSHQKVLSSKIQSISKKISSDTNLNFFTLEDGRVLISNSHVAIVCRPVTRASLEEVVEI